MDKIVMKQAMFELIDGLLGLVSQGLQTHPHQQRTRYVVALDTSFATLAILKTRELLGFAMKLLNLPAQGAHLLSVVCRTLRQVVGHDPFRAVGGHLNPEQLHFVVTRKAPDLDQFALLQVSLAPTQLLDAPVRCFSPTPTIVNQAIALEWTVEELAHSSYLHHHLFGGVPSVHQHCLKWQLAALCHRKHLPNMVQLTLAIGARVEDAVVNHPKLLRLGVDVHTRNQADASDYALFVAAPLTAYHLDVGSEAVVQHCVIEHHIPLWVYCNGRLHLFPKQSGREFLASQVAVDGIMAKARQMVCHVREGVVDLAAQQKLAVVEFADFLAHASTLPFSLPSVPVA